MNIFKCLIITITYIVIAFNTMVFGQENLHPRIYVTDQNRAVFLKTIENISWKKELITKKKERLQKYIRHWKNDSEWLVSRLQMNWKTKHDKVYLSGGEFSHSEGKAPVPTVRFSGTRDWATDYKTPSLESVSPYADDSRGLFLEHKKTGEKEWVAPKESGHIIEGINRKIMSLVEDAAFLYWVTGDKLYADFATPVFTTYIEGMYYRDAPVDLLNSNQQFLSGLATFEVIHEKVLINLITTYDFLFDHLKTQKVNLSHVDAVFQKWGDQIIKNGVPNNNWNLFQARFLTYVALILEPNRNYKNGKGREYYLDHTFNTSTDRQISIKESLLVYDQQNGVWPESASYSVHVITTLLNIITLLDNFTDANELSNFPIVEKAALASFQYLFPSGHTIGFGDSAHKKLPAENFELLITNYQKYGQTEKVKMISGLLNDMIVEGDYNREAKELFQLFFYVDEVAFNTVDDNSENELVSPTFYAPNVSWFNQRLGSDANAMMVATTGSYGNHAHTNGIAIELFAKGYVLAPDMGKGSSYWHNDHTEYYSRMPAHNTVVVNGISDYEPMRSHHPFNLVNSFPKSGENSIFNKVTFSNVSFVEPKTKAQQLRFTSLIKGPTGAGYMVDIFRSKKQGDSAQRHDYFYHNLGSELKLSTADGLLKLQETNDLGSHQGDLKAYDYLTKKKKGTIADEVKANFSFQSEGGSSDLMEVWIKGSANQSLYTVVSPKSKATTKGTSPKELLNKPVPTLIVQRNAEAWENPFALVFNPLGTDENNLISNVDFSQFGDKNATQLIEVKFKDDATQDNIVLNEHESAIVDQDGLYQKGLLSITRSEKNNPKPSFVFLSGMYKFEQDNWGVQASGEPVTISFEINDDVITVQNDQPVVLNIPKPEEGKEAILQIYENNKLITSRKGLRSWTNDQQLEFRLSKGYSKVLIKIQNSTDEE
ncbi:heparinase II/III domain-containing protein [Maribacter litoralis]|uniref:heparinase II/III domain-containing protein n=1 Tax=Maribacter litoralis TaxID=2059726 RepID=UPI001ABFE2DB|nr:heparinase II/III family protein [Maribacter litoralis]